ncbi:MAG: hypothetical protein K0S07_518, partial [Chlamydiales bacterium]|nr:hypothetical protein [Chlamydiales bacterium]
MRSLELFCRTFRVFAAAAMALVFARRIKAASSFEGGLSCLHIG